MTEAPAPSATPPPFVAPPPSAPPRSPARSLGLKLLLVCALALLMTIPALFVFALVGDRTGRAQEVSREIGALVGGPQTFLGPVLAVPYTVPSPPAQPGTAAQPAVSGLHLVFPDAAEAVVATDSDVRRRSLFQVPVYEADLNLVGRFDLRGPRQTLPPGAQLDWSRAELLVGASDARGAKSEIVVTAGDRRFTLAPASTIAEQALGAPAQPGAPEGREAPTPTSGLRFFGADASGLAQPDAQFTAAARLRFSGAERIAVLPFGRTSQATITGEWPDPSFDGGFLPDRRRVSAEGFEARWNVPFIARGVPASGGPEVVSRLGQSSLGVSFVEPANPYQSVTRSLKYALLFVGLVFLTFFVFESTTGKRVHPAQYVLVGLAQIIFYLLLLAMAEHLGFDLGFLIAAFATVGLISLYAYWAFDSRREGLRALGVFTLLYGGIYVLMRLEDYALLVGAVASFLAIAAVMWFTRRIDWYGLTETAPPTGKKRLV